MNDTTPTPRLAAAVGSLFTALRSRHVDSIEAKAAVAIFIADLSDLPIAAVERACTAFRRGDLGDAIWAPTSAQVRQAAIKIAARERPRPMLPPPVRPDIAPDVRERQAAEVRRLAREIAARSVLMAYGREEAAEMTNLDTIENAPTLDVDPRLYAEPRTIDDAGTGEGI